MLKYDSAHNVDLGEQNSPAAPAETRTRDDSSATTELSPLPGTILFIILKQERQVNTFL